MAQVIESQMGAWGKVCPSSVLSYAVISVKYRIQRLHIFPQMYMKKYIIISIKKDSLGPDTGFSYAQVVCGSPRHTPAL